MKSIKFAFLGLLGVLGMLVSMFGPIKIPFAETLAKTYYRYALGAVLVILLLIPIFVGLFLLTFNANNFKSEIIQFVKDRTQRELVLQGDIKVTFFPKLGLDSGKLSLSQRNSAKEFASVNNARLYIAWLPLFKRQLVFDRVVIDGIHANVIRLKDGTTNFDDLLISDEHLAPLTFDIDSVRITDSSINWQDELEAQRLSLHDLRLDTGHLTDKAPSSLTATFRLDSEMAHINSAVQLKSRLFFDRQAGRYEFADLEGKLVGVAGPVDKLVVNFKANVDSYPAQGATTVDDLVVSATGKIGQRNIEARLGMPSLKFKDRAFSGSQLAFDAKLSQPNETTTLVLQVPAFGAARKIFRTAEISADFDFNAEERTVHGKLTSPLSINLDTAPKFQLGNFALNLTGRHPVLSGELSARIAGNLQVDFAVQNAKLSFDAKFDESKIKSVVTLKDFNHPIYAFDISANRLDLDRYLSSEWIGHLHDDATIFNTSGLKDSTIQGNLRAGEFRMDKFKVSNLAANINVKQSLIILAPLTTRLYGGSSMGSVSITAHETPLITIKQKLKGLQMGALLSKTTGTGRLGGKASVDVDVSAQGSTVGSLRKALRGNVSFVVEHGYLAGINLRSALIGGKGDLGIKGAERIIPANFSELTDFAQLKSTFMFRDNKISTAGFEIKSALLRSAGDGEFDLGSGNMNFHLNTAVSSTLNRHTGRELFDLKGVTVPVRVNGPYGSPSITFDLASARGGNVPKLNAAPVASVQPHKKSTKRPASKSKRKPVK